MPITGQGVVSRVAGEPALLEENHHRRPRGRARCWCASKPVVCAHTDLHYKLGKISNQFPYLLGHEGAGVVGKPLVPGVESPAVGDYVVLAWRAPCGRCRFCAIGQPNLCAQPA